MGQGVTTKIAVATEDLAARGALVRLVIRVSQQMGLQVTALVETPGADRTLVRGLLHVEDLVNGEGAALTEALATLAAFERLLLAVNVPVEKDNEIRHGSRKGSIERSDLGKIRTATN